MNNITSDEEILSAMERYGGSFVKALAAAWRRADSYNFDRLRTTFSDYWEEYAGMAIHIKNG